MKAFAGGNSTGIQAAPQSPGMARNMPAAGVLRAVTQAATGLSKSSNAADECAAWFNGSWKTEMPPDWVPEAGRAEVEELQREN